MRKVYVVMGENLEKDYYSWIVGVWTSYKKACYAQYLLKKSKPKNNYRIETEILL